MSLFPSPCFFCSRSSEGGICPSCLALLRAARQAREKDLLFCSGARTLYPYECETVRRLVLCIKRFGTRFAVRFFADSMARELEAIGRAFSCITYVPRRKSQLRLDGVDQARLLAAELSRLSGIPMLRLLSRRGHARRQHDLAREERVANVRGKFRVCRAVPRGSVLLIDDIITTGATAEEVARVLLEAGVGSVFVFAPVRGGTR